jgi:hypothetical protein
VALLALVVLTACQDKQLHELSYAEQLEVAKKIEATCLSYGITPKMPEWQNCVNAEIQKESADRARNYQTRQRVAAGMAQMGQNMQNSNRRVNCTSTRVGSQINTNCF